MVQVANRLREEMRTIFGGQTRMGRCCLLFCWLMMLVFPLFVMPGFYFTLNRSKFFFVVGAVLLLCVCFVADSFCKKSTRADKKMRLADWAMVVLCGVTLLSGVVSEFFPDTINGVDGRFNGVSIMVCYAAVYFLLSRYCKGKSGILLLLAVSAFFVYLLGIANCLGYDLFGAYANIIPEQRGLFVSTIGNRNFFSTFICLSVSVCAVGFCLSSVRWKRVLYGVVMTTGFVAVFAANTDSGLLGVYTLFLLLCLCCAKTPAGIQRVVACLLLFLLAGRAYGLLSYAAAGPGEYFSAVTRFLSLDVWPLVGLLVLGLLLALSSLADVRQWLSVHSAAVRRALAGLLIAAAAVVLLFFLWFSLFDRTANLGELSAYLRFSESWGSGRGSVWIYLLAAFFMSLQPHLLIGFGPDTIYQVLNKYFPGPLASGELMRFDSAHNEYLQMLLTTGLVGLAAYLLLLVVTLVQGFRRSAGNPFLLACCAAVLCYAAQGVVNIAMVSTTPLLFVFLGLIASEVRRPNLSRI